jgi:hypothetical protein
MYSNAYNWLQPDLIPAHIIPISRSGSPIPSMRLSFQHCPVLVSTNQSTDRFTAVAKSFAHLLHQACKAAGCHDRQQRRILLARTLVHRTALECSISDMKMDWHSTNLLHPVLTLELLVGE